ncbi:MAG: hypothetical protein L6262_11750 [Weeksellaceae bacterium]|nr:hypothetical protein [Weeksellaceae bacterium]
MNFEHHIYQYLLKHRLAEVPDFGVFEISKEPAKIDAENAVIMPPKEIVTFRHQPAVFDNHLAKYIAEETDSNLFTVQMELKDEVTKWIQKLKIEKSLYLENLGFFLLDEQNNIAKANDSDDVFGLESIHLQNFKKTFPVKKDAESEDYALNKAVIWTFLLLLILGTASLFLFGDRDLIFGKSSQIPSKKITSKTEVQKAWSAPKKDPIKDSTKTIKNAKVQKIK